MRHFFETLDEMAKFPNTLGVMVAYELINDTQSMKCAPVLKAAVKDLKKYMRFQSESTGQRVLPIGYDASSARLPLFETLYYLSCGDSDARIDFVSCKGYEWVGSKSSIKISGWQTLIEQFQHLPTPIFFSEYGTTMPTYTVSATTESREFTETSALFSPAMTHVFSGGCVYEFWRSRNGYGMLQVFQGGAIVEKRAGPLGIMLVYADFFNYQKRLAAAREVEPNTLAAHTDRTGYERVFETVQRRDIADMGEVPDSPIDWAQFINL
ncbi:glycolipid-anchored surface protein 5 precursor [Pseudovirgaria hyperparasitica]|uniref:1,3-beta-glucanosyltransferase n=1 Tax=Pseudovirgaria hyperparasitica TaxID=470096 RepID=A0A6A6W1S0_9PEZI|nr:glycolipid-anchored surface protein 5 precursor [Pseudovirgaria hyperparasitica]KAF2756493.1 glycolipid-anchored surface protein 5 precursor [Pseudovirgaria hyperparasitica]